MPRTIWFPRRVPIPPPSTPRRSTAMAQTPPRYTSPETPTPATRADRTQIEDDTQVDPASEDESTDFDMVKSPMEDVVSPASQSKVCAHLRRLGCTSMADRKQPSRLDTSLPVRARADSDDGPQSVIHAPAHFQTFNRASVSAASSNETKSDQTAVVSPQTPEANMIPDEKQTSNYTHPIDTDVPASTTDRSTPRAQTRQDYDEDGKRRSARISISASLPDISETDDSSYSESTSSSVIENDESESEQEQERDEPATFTATQAGSQTMGEVLYGINETEKEVAALRNALHECWTLCNSLAKLSQHHRTRMFHYSGGRGEVQEYAWRTCWKLCQRLYESRDEDPATQISPTLELCRDFCQALFDVRQRGDEAADSVLRVSFELNNHLYNAHDRNLPEAFRERTLDFYLTLCHRLMKQRTSLPDETDALLHACWSLAEMLFNMRQTNHDSKISDEELLGSAIQACWELCDLFREGWTQVRPDRGTPRPSQYTFAAAAPASVPHSQTTLSELSGRSSSLNESYHSAVSIRKQMFMHPETPTTIFDDREEFSPAEEPNVPNILILGPEAGETRTHDRWSSSSSNLSTYSDTSHSHSVHTSSTATAGRDDPNLVRLKGLIVKAAINAGYSRQTSLPDFIRSLPSNSFGSISWQTKLFENYKKLVLTDPTLRNAHTQPLRRLTASEIGRAVQWMSRSTKFAWLSDLYRFVFGNYPDDVHQRNLIINA
ncbi:hypothetical protein P280DRAFT_103011 [Massarina eburnea CBS 473.64]|uniref:DUF7624 domain-containing protein n=1 Tax=Massarina eburnea CBS 473.64 TaxID=1395130 RepID=A0A6A6RSR1_9PLEO|nr:hypothetical protein P280DRAFT_103011 [Massarina eburnea CBS 473.64]